MSLEKSSKNAGTAAFHVGMTITDDFVKVLRSLLTTVKMANLTYGEDHYKDFLKVKGKRFKTEMGITRMAVLSSNSQSKDISKAAVSKDDLKEMNRLCKKYGCDFHFARRPKDLEQLVKRKYFYNEQLSGVEEKLVNAFILHDANNQPLISPETGIPRLSSNEYVFTIKADSWRHWEVICRELELKRNNLTFEERMKNAKIMTGLQNLKRKERNREITKSR